MESDDIFERVRLRQQKKWEEKQSSDAGLPADQPALQTQDNYKRGEEAPKHKLTLNEVKWIKFLYEEGFSQRDLAKEYGVSQSTIYCIVTNSTWQEVRAPRDLEQLIRETPGLEEEIEELEARGSEET